MMRAWRPEWEKKQEPVGWARRDPDFDNLRTDQHFKALVGEVDDKPATDANE